MRLSRYIHAIPSGDDVLIVGLIRRSVISIGNVVWDQLTTALEASSSPSDDIPDDLLDLLIDSRIIVEDEFDELKYVREQSLIARTNAKTFGLVLVPTISCNMRCHYCFENKPEKHSPLPDDVHNSIVRFTKDRLSAKSINQLHVRWFGGEPLSDIPAVESLSRALNQVCSDMHKGFSGDIVTNGFFLTRDVAVRLKNVGISSAQITFEGDKRQHDKIRRHGGKGSYEQIIENVLSASSHMNFSARVHVAPYNIKGIPDLLIDLKRRGIEKKLRAIYFAPLFNYRQGDNRRQFQAGLPLFLTSRDFAEQEVELLRMAKALGFNLLDPLDVDYGVCTALRENTAVVNADGSLAKCYLDSGDTSETFDHILHPSENLQNLEKWREVDFSNDEECAQCKFAPVCLGGCAKQAKNSTSKDHVCTSLKYNASEVLPLFYS